MIFLLFIFGLFFGCVPEKPTLVFQSDVLGDGGILIRDLYRSGWYPPAADQDLIRVGLLPSSETVRFRALHRMRLRALGERSSWEVASPAGVRWTVKSLGTLRPPLVSHFPVSAQQTIRHGLRPDEKKAALWKARGYPAARWVGPPPMDTSLPDSRRLERWILALTPSSDKLEAEKTCARVRTGFSDACQVVGRLELPALGRGRVQAENSNFSKDFEGLLELSSTDGPVEIDGVVPEDLTGEFSREEFGPRLFIVPRMDGSLSLVQQTSFENYLEGVVPAEIFPSAPDNALAAQAIVARTYAARYSSPHTTDLPYFICASTDCQVYRGVSYKRSGPSRAVKSTGGLVLFDENQKLANTFYHSICGGHTEPRTAIWGPPKTTYLGGVSDEAQVGTGAPLLTDEAVAAYLDRPATSFCGVASLTNKDRWRWSRHIDGSGIEKLVSSVGLSGKLLDVRVLKRGISGRVLDMEIVSTAGKRKLSGELRIRQALGGLWSSLFVFDVERSDGRVAGLVVRGGAYGHGVGLCQMGAVGRAEQGQSFKKILEAYYPGTHVDPLSTLVVE